MNPRGQGLRFSSTPLLRYVALTAVVAGFGAGAATWWIADSSAAAARDAAVAGMNGYVMTVADAAGSLLAAEDLSGARRLIGSLGQDTDADECRLELPGGTVIADLVPSRVTAKALPDPWPVDARGGTGLVAARSVDEHGVLTIRQPVAIDGRRSLTLVLATTLEGPLQQADSLLNALFVSLGISAAVLLVGLTTRRAMRDVLAVAESVASAAAGELHTDALKIDDRFGPLAPAWNCLLPRLDSASHAPGHEAPAGAVCVSDGDALGVCDALWHGVIVTDIAHRVRYMNGAAALLLGNRRETALGRAMDEILRDGELIAAVKRAAGGEAGARATLEVPLANAVGDMQSDSNAAADESILRFSIRSIASSAGGALLLLEDVTQQRLADRSRDAFVAQATHELRTPLTNVRLYVDELIEDEDQTTESRSRCLDVINQETRRLERMVGDMLSISEIEAGTIRLHPDDVRIEPMLKDLERDFKAQAAERKIGLGFRLPPKFPQLTGDRDKIQMTLANLLGNALKYTPESGSVSMTVKTSPEDVRFEITDSGIGIRDDEQELVFRSFYRSKDQRVEGIAGTGLGLPIARQIARLHGGDITVRSAIDKGSTFTLTVPLRQSASAAA